MITKDMENWLERNIGISDYPRENGMDSYSFRLQDFTDKQIRKVITTQKIRHRWQLLAHLIGTSTDTEVVAHLFGDKDAASRAEDIRQIREMIDQTAEVEDVADDADQLDGLRDLDGFDFPED